MDPHRLMKDMREDWQEQVLRQPAHDEQKGKKTEGKVIPLVDAPVDPFHTLDLIASTLDLLSEQVMQLHESIEETQSLPAYYDMMLLDMMHIAENMELSQDDAVRYVSELTRIRNERRRIKDFRQMADRCSGSLFDLVDRMRPVQEELSHNLRDSDRSYQFRTNEVSDFFEAIKGFRYDQTVPMYPPASQFETPHKGIPSWATEMKPEEASPVESEQVVPHLQAVMMYDVPFGPEPSLSEEVEQPKDELETAYVQETTTVPAEEVLPEGPRYEILRQGKQWVLTADGKSVVRERHIAYFIEGILAEPFLEIATTYQHASQFRNHIKQDETLGVHGIRIMKALEKSLTK